MRFEPKNTAKPPVERRSSTSPVQSASENVLTKVEEHLSILNPILKPTNTLTNIAKTGIPYLPISCCIMQCQDTPVCADNFSEVIIGVFPGLQFIILLFLQYLRHTSLEII
jgi:hypothetical protein